MYLCHMLISVLSTDITAASWPSPLFYHSLEVGMFSANLISLGKAFQICGPNDRRLFDPKVTWFGL